MPSCWTFLLKRFSMLSKLSPDWAVMLANCHPPFTKKSPVLQCTPEPKPGKRPESAYDIAAGYQMSIFSVKIFIR
jgi:hypothetical protein